MVAPPGDRSRRAPIPAVITFLVVAMVAAGCSGKPKDKILVEVAPTVPGTLTVATTLPAPGFWEGDDVTIVGGGYEWGLARALADEFDLNLKIIDVPFADIVAGDMDGADMALAQIEITDDALGGARLLVALLRVGLRGLDAARVRRSTIWPPPERCGGL